MQTVWGILKDSPRLRMEKLTMLHPMSACMCCLVFVSVDPITVKIQPVEPCNGFTYSMKDRNVSLNCIVISANPTPATFRWYHNNRYTGKGKKYLIPAVKRSSEGMYRCEADNGEAPHGEDTVTVNVHYPPVVTVRSNSLLVEKSRDLDIPCTADANPNITSITWAGKGTNTIIKETNGVLQLRNLTKTDSGTYICTAKNTITMCDGRILFEWGQAEVKVAVQYEPVIESFRILSKYDQKDVTVKEHTMVTFRCEVDSVGQANITIEKEGRLVNQTQKGISLSHVIRSAQCQDRGNFTCSATNIVGSVKSDTIQLLITSEPDQPTSLRVYNVKTRSLSLSWQKGFHGGAVQTFTAEYRRNGGQWIKHPVILSEQDDLHLNFDGLEPSTDYEIRLKAHNDCGSSDYIYINEKTSSDVPYALYGAVAGVVIVVLGVIIVVVVGLRTKRKQDLKITGPSRAGVSDGDVRVMEDNVMYEGYAGVSASGERGHNSGYIYAVVQKPRKANDAAADEIYANTGPNAVELKPVPKTGRDEDGLLYVSVDFDKEPTSDVIIGADVDRGQYSAIDFRSLGCGQNKESI